MLFQVAKLNKNHEIYKFRGLFYAFLVVIVLVTVRTAIETVVTDTFLGQTYRLYQVLDSSEYHAGQTQTTGNLVYHALVLW